MTNNGTSLKELFQGMQTDSAELMQGTVTQISPIKIQMANDEKLIINSRITIVPWHLTNYTTTCTIDWSTESKSGGSGESSYASHSHDVSGTKSITINNALEVGDTVYVLSINNGKLYIVLDRVEG